jgi:ATP diphosphatase
MQPSRDISRLIEIMARLRTPGSGCPWDLEQSFETIAPFTIEEAYEVADAIARGDLDRGLKDELGDLLLQVVFHARMAEEARRFDFGDVVEAITDKLVRRHPHVFGDAASLSATEVKSLWQRIKDQERSADDRQSSALDGVPAALPAITRAHKLQDKAAKVGFDWEQAGDVVAKIDEELGELKAVLGQPQAAAEEIGDLLFAVINLARKLDIDAESALRGANVKFERRFRAVEDALKSQGRSAEQASLRELDALWNEQKFRERGA